MSTEIQNLILKCCGRGSDIPLHVIEFVAETVAANVEEDIVLSAEDATTLLLDAGAIEININLYFICILWLGLGDMDEEDLREITSTIVVLTGGGQEQEDDNDEDDGTCEMCERDIRRSFHHLIPKETHNRYLKKGKLPSNIVNGELTRTWLNKYGVMVCRTCHSAIHSAVPNNDLAENYNSLDLLLTHPKIYAFAKYNSQQPARQRMR